MGPRAGSDVGDGTGGNVVGSTHRLFLGGAWKIFLVRGVGAAGGEPNCTGVAGTAALGVAGEWGPHVPDKCLLSR